jgi:hypothetical protein
MRLLKAARALSREVFGGHDFQTFQSTLERLPANRA